MHHWWQKTVNSACVFCRDFNKQIPTRKGQEQAGACGTRNEPHPQQSPLNQQHYGEICSHKSAYCQPAEGFIISGWKITQNAWDIRNADEWLICCCCNERGDFWSLLGFASKVIYETTLTSQRINNPFHEAGSCKLLLNEDKGYTDWQIVEFSLYLEFHSSFLSLLRKL